MSTRARFACLVLSILIESAASSAQTCVAPPSGMIAWWTLDETSGIIAHDSIGTEPAAYFGTPAPVPAPGEVAGGLSFNGSTDFLSAPQSTIWDFGTGDFTVELWANFAAVPGGDTTHPGAIFIGDDEGPGSQNKWFFALGGGVLEFVVYNTLAPPPNYFLVRAPFTPVVGQWYHLAVLKTGTLFTIFVNGVAVGSEVSPSPIANVTAPLTIGQAETLGFMNGQLDEISVYNRALSPAELQGIVNAGSAGKCKVGTATTVVPALGGNAGLVSVTVKGSGFTSATMVSLQLAGSPNIVGIDTVPSSDGTSLQTTFDLTGQPLGAWDVSISDPVNGQITLPGAFSIVQATPPQLSIDIVGGGAIRRQTKTQFNVIFTNRGNNDVAGATILVNFPVTSWASMQLPGPATGTFDPTTLDPTYTAPVGAFLIWAQVPASSVSAVPITLTVPATAASLNLNARIIQQADVPTGATPLLALVPLARSRQVLLSQTQSQHSVIMLVVVANNFGVGAVTRHSMWIVPNLDPQGTYTLYTQVGNSTSGKDQLKAVSGDLLSLELNAPNLFPGSTIYSGSKSLNDSDIVLLSSRFNALIADPTTGLPFTWTHSEEYPVAFDESSPKGNCDGILEWVSATAGLTSYPKGFVPLQLVDDIKWADPTNQLAAQFNIKLPLIMSLGSSTEASDAYYEANGVGSSLTPLVVSSFDPNAKFGSQGFGAQQYLSGGQAWPYSISFENDATATAPAQSVSVTDQFDPSFDLSTFTLGPIGFGNQLIVPPPGLSQYSTFVDLRPATSLIVGINASLNKTTGLATWIFSSLDPATGLPTTDPTAGFLPPDVTAPQGDGQVLFSVSPRTGLNTGQQILNSASVVFDTNAAIATPAWSNTIDSTPPVSNVLPLPAQSPASFPVSWRGSDVGSGVRDYTVYVSNNGGAFAPWLVNTPLTQSTYPGSAGTTYGFYSIARDLTLNIEPAKIMAEATTTVPGSSQTIAFSPLPNAVYGAAPISLGATASSGLAVTYSVSGPAALSGSTLSITGVGTVTVTASQAGSGGYTAAPSVTQTFTVSPAPLTVAATNASSAYGKPLPAFSYTVVGFVNGDASTVVSGSAAESTTATSNSAPGAYPINFSTESLNATNYTFVYVAGTLTISSASQAITFNPLPAVTYGAAPFALTAVASSSLPISYAATGPAIVSGSSLTVTGAGTVTVTASQVGNGNYSAATAVSQSFAVNRAALTVTARSASITAGQPLPSFGYSITGFVNGDGMAVVSGNATETSTATNSSSPGMYPITFSAESLVAANYTFAYVNGTLTIVAQTAQTITFNPLPNVNLGNPPIALAATSSSGLPVSYVSLTASICTVSGSTVALISAGTCSIEAMQPGNAIYAAAAPVTRSFTVLGNGSFTIQAIPAIETIRRGQTGAFALELKSVSGFTGNVTLGCSGGPPQSKCLDFPMVVKLKGAALAVSGISIPKTTVPGTYLMTVTGNSGQTMSSASAKIVVK